MLQYEVVIHDRKLPNTTQFLVTNRLTQVTPAHQQLVIIRESLIDVHWDTSEDTVSSVQFVSKRDRTKSLGFNYQLLSFTCILL